MINVVAAQNNTILWRWWFSSTMNYSSGAHLFSFLFTIRHNMHCNSGDFASACRDSYSIIYLQQWQRCAWETARVHMNDVLAAWVWSGSTAAEKYPEIFIMLQSRSPSCFLLLFHLVLTCGFFINKAGAPEWRKPTFGNSSSLNESSRCPRSLISNPPVCMSPKRDETP